MEVIIEKEYTYLVEHRERYLAYMVSRLDKWGYTCSHTDITTDDRVMTKFGPKQTNNRGV